MKAGHMLEEKDSLPTDIEIICTTIGLVKWLFPINHHNLTMDVNIDHDDLPLARANGTPVKHTVVNHGIIVNPTVTNHGLLPPHDNGTLLARANSRDEIPHLNDLRHLHDDMVHLH